LLQAKDKKMDELKVELGMDRGRGGRPAPGWPLRILEGAGLVAVLVGFAAWQPVWIALGVGAIVLSYAVYRKRHGQGGSDGTSGSGGPDGGDAGGGD
jgi:hypothetical protein